MNSRYFIERPILASVLSIVIVLAGLASMRALPIAQYPDIVPPEVQVTAFYPGASAEVVAATVARTPTVPVCGSTSVSVKSIRPVCGCTLPSASTTSTCGPPAGMRSRPSAIALRIISASFSA